MGKRKARGRDIDGLLLFDKPTGVSSSQALQHVKRLYHAAKAGHTGSLDPMASGMLPICFGEATKFSHYLLDADKGYFFTAKLGIRTTTSDAEGEVVEEREVDVSAEDIEMIFERYRGVTQQIPSMYSALKHNGQPLYKYARKGIEIEREPRDITLYKLEMLEFRGDEVDGFVHCSKGTYVRTLVDDIGQELGCGAHLIRLRRDSVGDFDEKMVSLEQLKALKDEQAHAEMDDLLLPVDACMDYFPVVNLGDDEAHYIQFGQPVSITGAPADTLLRLYHNKAFLGLGEIDRNGMLAPRRLISKE